MPSIFRHNFSTRLRGEAGCEVITMSTTRRSSYLLGMIFLGWLSPLAAPGRADVTVYDRVTTVGTPVKLAVRTTAFFMADGGRLVDLWLDEERIGRIMTGGDGYGYLRLTPQRTGLFRIVARSRDNDASGRLLVLEKTDRVVLAESETVLREIQLRPDARESCRATFESLRQRFRLIFVYRFLGADISRMGLNKEGLSPAVLIPWRGSATLENLGGRGVQVYAVIGSAEMVAAAGEKVPRRISFEKAKGARTVSGWEELAKALE